MSNGCLFSWFSYVFLWRNADYLYEISIPVSKGVRRPNIRPLANNIGLSTLFLSIYKTKTVKIQDLVHENLVQTLIFLTFLTFFVQNILFFLPPSAITRNSMSSPSGHSGPMTGVSPHDAHKQFFCVSLFSSYLIPNMRGPLTHPTRLSYGAPLPRIIPFYCIWSTLAAI